MPVSPQRILITGAAGFVGSHLVEALLAQGHQVIGFDNLSTGQQKNLQHAKKSKAFTFIQGDVRDQERVQQACEQADMVVHLAAQISASASMQDPATYHAVNATGTLNTLLAAGNAKVHRFLFASSAAVYGAASQLPISENAPLHPRSPYGVTKVAGELYCLTLAPTINFEVGIFRFFNIYGPRQPIKGEAGVVGRFLHRAQTGQPLIIYGDGTQTRDFIFIEDVVDVLLRAVEHSQLSAAPINVGTGQGTTIRTLAETIQQVWPNCSSEIRLEPPRPGDIQHSIAAVTRMNESLQFQAQYTIQQGLHKTIQAIKSTDN
jgi:UDP-glucose 4-epimerase